MIFHCSTSKIKLNNNNENGHLEFPSSWEICKAEERIRSFYAIEGGAIFLNKVFTDSESQLLTLNGDITFEGGHSKVLLASGIFGKINNFKRYLKYNSNINFKNLGPPSLIESDLPNPGFYRY